MVFNQVLIIKCTGDTISSASTETGIPNRVMVFNQVLTIKCTGDTRSSTSKLVSRNV